MTRWSRRDVLKSGVALPAANLVSPSAFAAVPAGTAPVVRQRLLLDFGWRFHFGHATDAAKDFGYNSGRNGSFQKTGNFLPAAALPYDDSGWTDLGLPHDWVISLPFKKAHRAHRLMTYDLSNAQHKATWCLMELTYMLARGRLSACRSSGS